MEEWVKVISQTGFPIGVAMFCLLRLDKTIAENTNVMKEFISYMKGAKNE